jgi:Rrf2 family transcriptional regulator, iron-sulfur cluster assembly transcription factor
MLSQTAEYALRAVLHLASEVGEEGRLPVAQIAEPLGVPQNYLSKVLHTLAREGVLTSNRGPGGGFGLAVPAESLPLSAVVDPFDRLTQRQQCLLGRSKCSDTSPCAAHGRWKEIAEQLRQFFEETTIAELLEQKTAAGRLPWS